MSDESCGTCRFNKNGLCRRFPPVPYREERQGRFDRYVVDVWSQPGVYDRDWCGEYQRAPQAGDGQLVIKGESE